MWCVSGLGEWDFDVDFFFCFVDADGGGESVAVFRAEACMLNGGFRDMLCFVKTVWV